jgi:hypothetical protein
MDKPFDKGDAVVVLGRPSAVMGEALEAATLDEMPDLGAGSASKEAIGAMREQRADLPLLIGYRRDGEGVCFFARHSSDGWIDLRDQKLRVLKGSRGGMG